MSEVWKAFGLRDRARKGSNIIAATSSRCEVSRRLHGLFREEKVVNGSNLLKNHDGGLFYFLCFLRSVSFSASFASAIITTSFMLVGRLVALRTNLSLHPHSLHSNFGGVSPM